MKKCSAFSLFSAGIPAALFALFLLGLNPVFSQAAISTPSAEGGQLSQARLYDFQQKSLPQRRWIFPAGAWEVFNPRSGEKRGEIQLPFSFHDSGHLRLKKTFDWQESIPGEAVLHLQSINGLYTVSLNDSTLFRGSSRYLPVSIPLPASLLKRGANSLQIDLARNTSETETAPVRAMVNMPRIDAGILHGVFIEILPPQYVQQCRVGVSADSTRSLQGEVRFNRLLPDSGNYQLLVQLETGAESIFRQQAFAVNGLNRLDLPAWSLAVLQPWRVTEPRQYWLELQLLSNGRVVDIRRQPLALRAVGPDDNWLHRPGEPINGINYVYQTPDGAEWFNLDLVRKDLEEIRERGYNALRVIFHPLPEPFYQLCDELGLRCFQDLPIVFSGLDAERVIIPPGWNRYYREVEQLAERYSSLSAIGLAYYIDLSSEFQRDRFEQFRRELPGPGLPTYISTMIPQALSGKVVDFQLLDIVDRNRSQQSLPLAAALAGHGDRSVMIPSGFSRPLTYRIDAEFLVADSLQIGELEGEVLNGSKALAFPGHFIRTFSDYYVNMPSLQNGLLPRDRAGRDDAEFYYLSRVGLLDLARRGKADNGLSGRFQLGNSLGRGMMSESKGVHSYLYILVGILNLFFFLVIYKRFKIFRQNVHYSIKKPHGFFVNLQERISVPYKQSFFLLLVIAVNASLVYSSVSFYYRFDLRLDYLLSVFTGSPWLKEQLLELIWNQPRFLLFATVLIALLFCALAVPIKLLALAGRTRVPFSQALAASIWSGAPLVLLLPLGIFMYNLLITVKSYWILFAILLYFHAWCYMRWINGARVLTDRLYSRVFLLLTFVVVLLIAGVGYYYYRYENVLDHIQVLQHLSALVR